MSANVCNTSGAKPRFRPICGISLPKTSRSAGDTDPCQQTCTNRPSIVCVYGIVGIAPCGASALGTGDLRQACSREERRAWETRPLRSLAPPPHPQRSVRRHRQLQPLTPRTPRADSHGEPAAASLAGLLKREQPARIRAGCVQGLSAVQLNRSSNAAAGGCRQQIPPQADREPSRW